MELAPLDIERIVPLIKYSFYIVTVAIISAGLVGTVFSKLINIMKG